MMYWITKIFDYVYPKLKLAIYKIFSYFYSIYDYIKYVFWPYIMNNDNNPLSNAYKLNFYYNNIYDNDDHNVINIDYYLN